MREQRLGRAIGGDRFGRFRASALPRLCDLITGGDELSQKWRLPAAGGRLSSNLRAGGDESAGRVDRLRALIGLAQSPADQPLSGLSGRGDFHQASVQCLGSGQNAPCRHEIGKHRAGCHGTRAAIAEIKEKRAFPNSLMIHYSVAIAILPTFNAAMPRNVPKKGRS